MWCSRTGNSKWQESVEAGVFWEPHALSQCGESSGYGCVPCQREWGHPVATSGSHAMLGNAVKILESFPEGGPEKTCDQHDGQ